jgi:hypothetical protein
VLKREDLRDAIRILKAGVEEYKRINQA